MLYSNKLMELLILKVCLFLFQTFITKTHLFKYIENFSAKNCKFSDKNLDIFHISAQNIDCGYFF